MRSKLSRGLWVAVAALTLPVLGGPTIQTLNLKPFVGPSPVDTIGANWLLPHGEQVLDGTPFQIDGVILMYGDYAAQKKRPGRTNVNDIPVGRSFDSLHLLATAQSKAADGTPLTRILFQYADGSSNSVEVSYGVHVRNWFGPWHKADAALADPNVREAWRGQFSAAATTDDYLRLFHVVLTNPAPTKLVQSLSLESLKKPAGLMIAAISVGPAQPEPGSDTVSTMKNPFPDLRPRSGELARGEGVVKTIVGEPLAGARVRVVGTRKFGASYYNADADDDAVGAGAVTDADGRFALPPLPDDRLYHLLIFAEGLEPAPFGGMDVKSDPVEVRLKPPGPPGKFMVWARVLDSDDQPVAGATVEPEGVGTGGGTSWGNATGFPEQTLTSTNGEFTFSRNEMFTRLQIRVKATGFAPALEWLVETNNWQTIKLGEGATLRGRVVKNGEPLAGVRVGVAGADRNSEVYVGHYETRTRDDGTFAFAHLPRHQRWYFYGIMSSLKTHGAIAPRAVSSGANGTTNDLADVEVTPGLRLAGQVQTRHDEPLPKGLKVRLGYDTAWDSQTVTVDEAGRFELVGLAPGKVEVSVDQRGWRLAGANRSLDTWNSWQLTGLLEQDKADLVLLIEPGERDYNSGGNGNGQLPQADWPQSRPLSGVEKSGPLPIVLAGQVVDDRTGEPITLCKIIPGYKPPVATGPKPAKPVLKQILEPFTRKSIPWNERTFWKYSQTETVSNGNFSLSFVRLSSTPVLRVEAADYAPFETETFALSTNQIVIRLKRGTGPNGVVLLPDGKPAEGATILFGASQEQFGLTGKELADYGHKEAKRVTNKDGKFSFPARSQGLMLFVSHPAGWAEHSVTRGADDLKLRLQPWATVTGTLMLTNGVPAAGVVLGVTLPSDWQRGDPHINVNGQITTDAQGRFRFPAVPPRRVEIQRVIPAGGNGWTWNLQTWLFVKPGVTNDLGQVEYDHPPPPPILDQIKQRIGL